MYIHFDKERMQEVIDRHDRWWNGTLGRPLVSLKRLHVYPGAQTQIPTLQQSNCHDFSYSPRQIIEAWDREMSDEEYEGDGYPFVNLGCFGPGIVAAMCGGTLDNSSGAVWFRPGEKTELKEIHPRYDPENKWAKRIKDIYYAGLEYWDGAVIMSLPDLGGVMDVAASLRGTENLLTDLYDDPEEVLRLVSETEKAWYDAYNDFASVLAPQKACTTWCGLLSSEPNYIIQCDFCYMIGNPMFREFVLPTLARDVKKLPHTIYHLDGPGEIKHLDDVLKLPELAAVQWIPGAGNAPTPEWPEIYEKITAAGKSYWLCGSPDDYFSVLEQVHGDPYYCCCLDASEKELAEKLLRAR